MKKVLRGLLTALVVFALVGSEPMLLFAEEPAGDPPIVTDDPSGDLPPSADDQEEGDSDGMQEGENEETGDPVQQDDLSAAPALTAEPAAAPAADPDSVPVIEYSAHVQGIGWQTPVTDGGVAGTTGRSLRMEALRFSVKDAAPEELSVYSKAHVQGIGWQEEVQNGMSGTTGRSFRMEAMSLRLDGTLAPQYHIYYRLHISGIGWLPWVKDGELSGSSGLSLRVEAAEVKLVKDGEEAPTSSVKTLPYYAAENQKGSYRGFVGSDWQAEVGDGAVVGTTGKSTPLSGFAANVSGQFAGTISYQTSIMGTGWTRGQSSGAASTGSGAGSKIEVICIALHGEVSGFYDVYYRAHVAGLGWLGWTKNGNLAGSSGYSYAIEAVQVRLVPKGSGSAPALGKAYQPYVPPYKLLAEFTTVSQNTANGTYNMSRALSMFNNVTIQPGQTISFNGICGYCGAANGYKIAGVVGGTGYGGGICQASTTLYGAAIRAGLTIVERHNHSVKSVYVPVGLDAMINYGTSDLRIRNPYSRPVTLKTWTDGRTLHCQVWGYDPGWFDRVEAVSWATSSTDAAACRIYYKNGREVKRESLPSSHYRR